MDACVGRESNPGQLLGRQLCSPLYHQRYTGIETARPHYHKPRNSSEQSLRKLYCRAKPAVFALLVIMAAVGFEPTPQETGALMQRLRALGNATLRYTKALSN